MKRDPKAKPLTDSKRYVDFSAQKDQALEAILRRYLRATHTIERGLKKRVLEIVHAYYTTDVFPPSKVIANLDHRLTPEFQLAVAQLATLMERQRVSTYLLSHVGEAEAIGRALGKPQKADVQKHKLELLKGKETPSGGSPQARVELALSRLKRDILDAIQLSITVGSTLPEALERVERCFPKVTRLQRQPRVLKNRKVAEADKPRVYLLGEDEDEGPVSLSTGILDAAAWEDVKKDYLGEDLDDNIFRRGPHDKMLFFNVNEDQGTIDFEERYEWELEQEFTEDFVKQVRDGQVSAANENGINDLISVAVIDDHTDTCCVVRDGLTTREIEEGLKSGEIDADECDGITAPYHIRCRCKMVPASEDLPDESPPDFGDFDSWLEQKAAA